MLLHNVFYNFPYRFGADSKRSELSVIRNNCPIQASTELSRFFLTLPRNTATRAKVVEDWAQDGGVLLMGYEMYRLLSLKKSFVAGRKKKGKKATGPVVIDLDEEDRQQELLKGGRDGGEKRSGKWRENYISAI